MKKYSIIGVAGLMAAMASCGGNGSKSSQEDSAAIADSIREAEEAEMNTELPDTAYESVKLINATTRVIDTITDPKIDSYKDLYRNAPGVFAFRANA